MGRISGVALDPRRDHRRRRLLPPRGRARRDGLGLRAQRGLPALRSGLGLGWLAWDRASMRMLAIGMVLTIPVVGLAIYLTGGATSFVQPMLVTLADLRGLLLPHPLGLAALDRVDPRRRHAAALRRERDRRRLPAALRRPRRRLPLRDLGAGRPAGAAAGRRAAPAGHRLPRPPHRRRQPAPVRRDAAARAGAPVPARRPSRRPTRARWGCCCSTSTT